MRGVLILRAAIWLTPTPGAWLPPLRLVIAVPIIGARVGIEGSIRLMWRDGIRPCRIHIARLIIARPVLTLTTLRALRSTTRRNVWRAAATRGRSPATWSTRARGHGALNALLPMVARAVASDKRSGRARSARLSLPHAPLWLSVGRKRTVVSRRQLVYAGCRTRRVCAEAGRRDTPIGATALANDRLARKRRGRLP